MHRDDDTHDSAPCPENMLGLASSLATVSPFSATAASRRNTEERSYDLRFNRVYYPLGFPVHVHSNTPLVLTAADQSWAHSTQLFLHMPLRIDIRMQANDGSIDTLPPAPRHEIKEDHLILTAGHENMLVADLKNGRACGRVAESAVRCHRYFRYHFLEGAALSLISAVHCLAIHAACVEWEGNGMLLCGDSGAGKSTLAFASMRSGFTYVCDDASYLVLGAEDRLVVGNCHSMRFRPSAQHLFPEITGQQLTPHAAGKPSIEMRTSRWPHLRTTPSSRVSFLVFLNRQWSGDQELVAIQPQQVRAWFEASVLPVKHAALKHEAALEQLLAAKIFEMRFRDLAWAIDRLKSLARYGG